MESSLESISIIKEDINIKNQEYINNVRKIINEENELDFDKSLELSKIDIKEEQLKPKNKNEDDISDYSFIKDNNISYTKNKINTNKNRITKEELNNIPLPIFSCVYCCDDKISFRHLSNEILSNKYLFQTSIYDMKQLDILISGKRTQRIFDNKLLNIVINNFENLNGFFNKNKIRYFFGSEYFGIKCEKSKITSKKKFRIKLEEQLNKKKKDFYFKEIKGMYKISKNSLNNKCLFNSNSIMNNYSSLAGLIPSGPELIQNITEKKNNSLNSSHISNLYIQANSKSWKKNEIGLIGKDNNKHYVENIIEKIDKNVESDIFEFLGENDLKRKINKKDIEWEETYYDINKPVIDEDNIEDNINKEENVLNYISNKNNKNRNKAGRKIENQQNIINNNNSKHISINSENKSHLKLSIFNNSKSLTSTNTSSNIIQKNKENRSLSIFLNKNKINNIENNSSSSPRNNIIIKNIKKINRKIKESELSPSFSKKRINEFDTKSYKKLFGNGKISIDSKIIHKKILFNHTVNINKDIKEYKNMYINHFDIDLKLSKLNIKENQKNLFINNINNKIKENINNKSYNKINNNKNNDNTEVNNKGFLDKMIKRFKSNKDNNKKRATFNSVFKFNKDMEQPKIKSPISNIKYSLILPQNKENKFNALNFNKNFLNIKNTENEYTNNFLPTSLYKKENNVLERKFITENNNNENIFRNRNINYMKNGIRIIS